MMLHFLIKIGTKGGASKGNQTVTFEEQDFRGLGTRGSYSWKEKEVLVTE